MAPVLINRTRDGLELGRGPPLPHFGAGFSFAVLTLDRFSNKRDLEKVDK
jgi:hypothetical protein